ncbi:hypothetical protein SLEP1_g17338 [Rubroshorea leprosula]|uniref:Uncharacterized protein n=1 Tax=Rubroshorea leprosula TaxID=152421 RepID=A0AAV5J4G7_9ROSI|nr:hypothetical protein SLEP1_g17338 [Rubroshorea leprosula]
MGGLNGSRLDVLTPKFYRLNRLNHSNHELEVKTV